MAQPVSPDAGAHDSLDATDHLSLADWRRRVAGLYAEVRRLASTDPRKAHEHWRTVREQLYREHPQSPLPAERRSSFRASHFPYDPGLRFEVAVEGDGAPEAASPADAPSPVGGPTGLAGLTIALAPAGVALPVSAGEPMRFERIGAVRIPFPEGERQLTLYWMAGYAGGLFLPFGDATNGTKTYGAGRYAIDAAKSADLGGDPERRTIVVDFNFAFQPSCAFDPRWACPLAPPENRLDIPIRAGERL